MSQKKSGFFFVLGLTWGAAVASGQAPGIIRQGSYWMQTSVGTVAAPAGGKLVVKTQGGVVVRGGTGAEVKYVLRTRVQARSEAEAVRQLRAVSLRMAHRAAGLEMDLVRPSRNEGGVQEVGVQTDSQRDALRSGSCIDPLRSGARTDPHQRAVVYHSNPTLSSSLHA